MNIQNASEAPATAVSNEHDEAFSHDDVARVAKQIWEDEGCPEGKAEEHWQRAEEHLRNGQAKPAAAEVI
jgi:hypothetical protein